jgi:anti-sigma-K factor RskA
MERKQIEELLPFYTLETLTDEERELVDSYAEAHPDVREQIKELRSASEAVPYSVAMVEPSLRLKNALMTRVEVDKRFRNSGTNQLPRPDKRRLINLFPALSFAIAAVAVIWVVILNFQLAQLRNEISVVGEALIAQSNTIEQINAKLPQTPVSGVTTISLKGTEFQPRAQGELIANLDNQTAILVITGLSQLESGKTYQVWLIDAGGPKSAGLLSVDVNGQGILVVTSEVPIGAFDALGISIEPDGGSSQPTGDIVLLSEL